MTVSVIVPTFRRVDDLRRCLAALRQQMRPADEVLVVVRDSDDATHAFLRSFAEQPAALRVVDVSVPGVIAAMNAGLDAATGEIISLTDDDAAPRPDWLERIEAAFAADPHLGGFGGRDWLHWPGRDDDSSQPEAGRLSWFGRVSAGHHAVVGPPREVDVLKGVNCAYRAAALRPIRFDSRLAGTGAQVHWELSLGLALKRAGWKLVLDPALAVDHYPAVRFDEDRRNAFNALAQRNAAANETLVLFEHLHGLARFAFVGWAGMVGTRAAPGLAQVPRLWLAREPNVVRRWWATLGGRIAGLGMYRNDRRKPINAKAESGRGIAAGTGAGT